jgi:NAD(P)-dependent dehydrogenase (short-subunit alcohol dehydrogenase family)
MRFKDRVLFVTGGGSGIGAATARRFASEGGRVAVVDLSRENAAKVAKTLPEGQSIAIGIDVSDEAAVKSAIAETHQKFGRIDCVFNGAGHVVFGPIETFELAEWNRIFAVHAGGTFLVCKHVLPIMRAQGRGAIVNCGSTAALSSGKNNGPYAGAKGAIITFSQQLALDAGPEIRVNVLIPGRTLTGMTEKAYTERYGTNVEEAMKAAGQVNIQKRVARPEELAAPICFLLSDDASFITATRLVVDGGQTAI